MDRQVEAELFGKLTKLAPTESYGEICSEIGKFVEAVTIHACLEETGKRARNTKEAIDIVAKAAIISPTLVAKLHVVRTLRNADTHALTDEIINTNHVYQSTKADARFAVEVLNEFLAWLHDEKIEAEWNRVLKQFQRCEQLVADKVPGSAFTLIMETYAALRHALDLKIRSLGLKAQNDLTSDVEDLLKHGIDVRSETWKRLATLRVYAAHGTNEQQEELLRREQSFANEMLPELRQVLSKLNPLRRAKGEKLDCPRVPPEVLEVLAG